LTENQQEARVTRDSVRRDLTSRLKAEAKRLGFSACGISRAGRLDTEARRLEMWLQQGRHGTMQWMEGHFEKRVDPRRLVDGAKSVVTVIHNYFQADVDPPTEPSVGRISRYAWGDDYHLVLKEKLALLYRWLEEETGDLAGRAFVDSAPVMDKVWAERSGLGWIGKHSNLIRRDLGSYFFIGELILDVDLVPDEPAADHCGTCTRCIDACPTRAIVEPYVVDSNRCISYLTIEFRGDTIEPPLSGDMGNWIFGCDICQDVCPWNKYRRPASEPRYRPRAELTDTPLKRWAEIDLDAFRKLFKDSAVRRTGFEGLKRNVRIALRNAEGPDEETGAEPS
jgi:epoxyqueuosine reductase